MVAQAGEDREGAFILRVAEALNRCDPYREVEILVGGEIPALVVDAGGVDQEAAAQRSSPNHRRAFSIPGDPCQFGIDIADVEGEERIAAPPSFSDQTAEGKGGGLGDLIGPIGEPIPKPPQGAEVVGLLEADRDVLHAVAAPAVGLAGIARHQSEPAPVFLLRLAERHLGSLVSLAFVPPTRFDTEGFQAKGEGSGSSATRETGSRTARIDPIRSTGPLLLRRRTGRFEVEQAPDRRVAEPDREPADEEEGEGCADAHPPSGTCTSHSHSRGGSTISSITRLPFPSHSWRTPERIPSRISQSREGVPSSKNSR